MLPFAGAPYPAIFLPWALSSSSIDSKRTRRPRPLREPLVGFNLEHAPGEFLLEHRLDLWRGLDRGALAEKDAHRAAMNRQAVHVDHVEIEERAQLFHRQQAELETCSW